MKVAVLLSTYNGEKYLKDQLNSLVQQDLKPSRIVIRDDGSTDSTLAIIKYYADNYNFIEYYQGENIGPAKSFFELINKVQGYDYYALCDQDDVWFSDKLKVAVETLNKRIKKSIPLLYASRVVFTDKDLNKIEANISSLYSFTDFAHSLLYQTAPGCTMVFNDAAREKIVKYDINSEFCIIHDSLIHKICTMFGEMVLDDNPHMYYRQHDNNAIGLPTNKYEQFIIRIKRFVKGINKNYRKNTALSLLNVYSDDISEENKELLTIVGHYDDDIKLKKELLNKGAFKTQSINDLFFVVLVLANFI